MDVLVGYTGFVGSNIYDYGTFDHVFNSKNIEQAYGLKPDLLIYAGLRAEKYLANTAPESDMELIIQAENNITKIAPKKLVLISTIDVFEVPQNVAEDALVCTESLQPYGYNRYRLECWVKINYPTALIIRLPGLFGKNIKKNFIYDYIRRIPFMLKKEKFIELISKNPKLDNYYELQNNGFYKCRSLLMNEELELKQIMLRTGFSALYFTDSRNIYQFYPLKRLWNDIQIALKNNIHIWHPATEPISAGELYKFLCNEEFINEIGEDWIEYNYKTVYAELFGGKNGYICNKQQIMEEIRTFVEEERNDGK